MVRAFAVCAVILLANVASAQSVEPRIVYDAASDEKLGIEAPEPSEPTPASACGKHKCASSAALEIAEKPVDNQALLKQKLAEMNCLQSEIDELRTATGTPQQILVKVKAIEVSRTKLQRLDIDVTALREDHHAHSAAQAPSTASAVGLAISDSAAVNDLIEQLRKNNVGKVLAEPNLVAISGRPASFNVGGEVPLPTHPGSNQAVEFKPFGTQVDVLAVAQGDHRVRLDLRARIGEIDASKQIEINGVKVPAISVRQIDTGVDLRFGQTAVFSGLVQQRTERQEVENKIVDCVNEIELLFLVTPEIVAPINPHHAITVETPAYRTATSNSQDRPKERSLRVTKPRTPQQK